MFHRPPVLHRLFFALLPPPALARRIAAAASWFRHEPGGIAAERLHLTLFILDDMPEVPSELIRRLHEVGAALAADPFDIVLDTAGGSGRSIALRPGHRNPSLMDVRDRLVEATRQCGVTERPDYRFAPHLTLGYRGGAPFSQRIAPVRWTAEDVVLIDSHVGRTRHAMLARWPLTGADDRQLALF